jgi:hypothetical protein
MPDSSITPAGATYLGQSKYTVNSSDRVTIEAALTLTLAASVTFTLTYPAAAAPTGDLVQGASSMALAATPVTGTNINANRRVTITVSPVGTDTVMTVVVETLGAAPAGEPWTIRVRDLGVTHQCAFEVTDGTLVVTRMMCDAHAGFLATPATALEGSVLAVAAKPALVKGVDPVNAATKVNYIGPVAAASDPKTRYRWWFSGPATINDLPAVTTTAGTSVNLPATVFQLSVTVNLKLQAWLTDDSTPPTAASIPGANDLPATADPSSLTIAHRPQRLMVVLDRTGSMSGDKWKYATTAARMMTHLFSAIRAGNTDDRVGIVLFDDATCAWHNDPISATTKEVLALSDVSIADATICGLNLGNPGDCTNIGDAIYASWQKLAEAAPVNTRYAAVLITDGIENAGHRKIDKTTNTGGAPVLEYTAPNELFLSSIGVGSDVNSGALNAIAGANVFHSVPSPGVTNVKTLKDAATQSVAQLFNANGLTITKTPSAGDGSAMPGEARYFVVNGGEHRVAFAVETVAAADTLEIKVAVGTGAFEAPSVPASVTVKPCSSHIFVVVDLDQLFGGGAVGQTEWGIVLKSGAPATNVPDLEDRLLAWADLRAKADHVFDKHEYRTGEPLTVTVRLRDGDQVISGARVSVTMRRPRRSVGDFLARNSGLVLKGDGGISVGPATHGGGRGQMPGDSTAKSALFDAILQARGETDIGWEEPPGIFADGTNDLHELAGTGNYSNVYTQTNKEGAVSFKFYVDGTLADGSAFSRVVIASKWIGVKVDPLVSNFTLVYNVAAPAGYQAVQVSYKPQDRFGNLLGPFREAELNFVATSGTWDGDVVSELDGTYHRTLLYKKEDGVPVVTVETQGTSTVPLPVSRGCLALILRPLLWLVLLILRILRRS